MRAHFLLKSANNANGGVYCLRARDRVASAARRSPDVLPYLGPEIIAFMRATSSSSPNGFAKTPPYLPWQKRGQNRVVAALVTQSELVQVKERECSQGLGLLAPAMRPCLDAPVDLGWINNLLAFIKSAGHRRTAWRKLNLFL
jgi:hypothetical protein